MRPSTTRSLVLLLLIAALGWSAPLTHEQALAKIAEWGPDVTADKIVALDTILQATPAVMLPNFNTIIWGENLTLFADPAYVTVDVKPWIHYQIRFEDVVMKGAVPRCPCTISPWVVVAGVLVGAAAGAVGVILLR